MFITNKHLLILPKKKPNVMVIIYSDGPNYAACFCLCWLDTKSKLLNSNGNVTDKKIYNSDS